MVNEGENKAILWIKDENKIQRDLIHRCSGKISVIERDLSGGQRALIHILRSEYPPSRDQDAELVRINGIKLNG